MSVQPRQSQISHFWPREQPQSVSRSIISSAKAMIKTIKNRINLDNRFQDEQKRILKGMGNLPLSCMFLRRVSPKYHPPRHASSLLSVRTLSKTYCKKRRRDKLRVKLIRRLGDKPATQVHKRRRIETGPYLLVSHPERHRSPQLYKN